jgi:hypothetical protein
MKSIAKQIDELRAMKLPDLVKRYRKLFNKDPRVKNKVWLWKRCAWRLQEMKFGGLSGTAQRRLDELIAEIDLPIKRKETGKTRRPRAPGDLSAGTSLTRTWHGSEYHVKVLEEGFEYDGVVYRSLSAVARAITGSHWNGKLFFHLTRRKAK